MSGGTVRASSTQVVAEWESGRFDSIAAARRHYQSAGVSLNLRVELDQSLLVRPHDLQAEIVQLYHEAEEAVSHQLDQTPWSHGRKPQPTATVGHQRRRCSHGHA
jgi:hypothetical protein